MIDADLTVGPPGEPEVAATVERPAELGGDAPFSNPLAGDGFELAPVITDGQVRTLLESAGVTANAVLADDELTPDVWRFTDEELDALVPPLTRIVNKRPAVARAVERGDEVAVALLLTGYGARNLDDMAAAKKTRKAAEAAARNPHLGGSDDAHGQREARSPVGDGAPRARGDGGFGWPHGAAGDHGGTAVS